VSIFVVFALAIAGFVGFSNFIKPVIAKAVSPAPIEINIPEEM
jgi:hypothetical protein